MITWNKKKSTVIVRAHIVLWQNVVIFFISANKFRILRLCAISIISCILYTLLSMKEKASKRASDAWSHPPADCNALLAMLAYTNSLWALTFLPLLYWRFTIRKAEKCPIELSVGELEEGRMNSLCSGTVFVIPLQKRETARSKC